MRKVTSPWTHSTWVWCSPTFLKGLRSHHNQLEWANVIVQSTINIHQPFSDDYSSNSRKFHREPKFNLPKLLRYTSLSFYINLLYSSLYPSKKYPINKKVVINCLRIENVKCKLQLLFSYINLFPGLHLTGKKDIEEINTDWVITMIIIDRTMFLICI